MPVHAHFVSNEVPHAYVLDYLTQIDIHHLSRERGNNEQIRLIGLHMYIRENCADVRTRVFATGYIDRDYDRLCSSYTRDLRLYIIHTAHRSP